MPKEINRLIMIMIALEEANQYLGDREKLINSLMDNGYLFIRNLLTESVTRLNRDIVNLLKKHGYVSDHSDLHKPVVTSKIPDSSMLSEHHGFINRKIANLQSLKEISQGGEAKQVLGKIVGTPLYSWVENKDRVRVVQPSNKMGYATAPHQDAFHFRTKFVTMWVPLTDISENEGGLALRKLSHTEGLHKHWFRSGEYLGVADNNKSASTWLKSGATVTGGKVEEDDISKVWLHSNYKLGDCLIFIPQMVHAGLPNISGNWRISGDFRFQNKRNVMPWQARHRLGYTHSYLEEVENQLSDLNIQGKLGDHIAEKMRLEGPNRRQSISERVKNHAKGLSGQINSGILDGNERVVKYG